MIKQSTVIFVLFALLHSFVVNAREIRCINIPESITVQGENLILNGVGVRKVLFIDLYVIGLYLKSKAIGAKEIINADETMALKIQIITDVINSNNFRHAVLEGFEFSTGGNTNPIQKEIDLFLTAFSNNIKNRDSFKIIYQKDQGLSVSKNGQQEPLVVVKGFPIKKAVFGLWLGPMVQKMDHEFGQYMLGLSK